MGTVISGEPLLIFQEDIQYGASVSEAVETKKGSANNFILKNFTSMQFGVVGASFSDLVFPYTFSTTREIAVRDFIIENIVFSIGDAGTASSTIFRIEKQLAGGGSWVNIFSTNPEIGNNATNELVFDLNTSPVPTGVTIPVVSDFNIAIGDKLRLVIQQAATGAANLEMKVILRPV